MERTRAIVARVGVTSSRCRRRCARRLRAAGWFGGGFGEAAGLRGHALWHQDAFTALRLLLTRSII